MKTVTSVPDSAFADALHARGMRVTPQRLAIREAVAGLGRHATAEQVAEAVSRRVPGVSLPTVYATLDLLEDLGAVRRIPSAAGPALYDPRAEPHQHMVCRCCGTVEDLDVTVDGAAALDAARRAGFAADGVETVVSGLCARCASR